MAKAAMTMLRCPKRLAELLGGAAFGARLVVFRLEEATVDPGATMPNLDDPFTDDENLKLGGMLAAYEVADAGDTSGARVEPPRSKAELWADKATRAPRRGAVSR
jgi:hypothetical protein